MSAQLIVFTYVSRGAYLDYITKIVKDTKLSFGRKRTDRWTQKYMFIVNKGGSGDLNLKTSVQPKKNN